MRFCERNKQIAIYFSNTTSMTSLCRVNQQHLHPCDIIQYSFNLHENDYLCSATKTDRDDGYTQMSCDLLENYYLCSISNNSMDVTP